MPRRPRTQLKKQAKQDRSRATVDAILEAASRILVTAGYDKTSTTRIARRAGVSVGSLYQYFPGKEAIVAELIDRHVHATSQLLAAELAAVATLAPALAIRRVATTLFAAYAVDPALHRVFVEQVPRIGRLDRIREVDAALIAATTAYLRAHRDELAVTDCNLAAFVVIRTVTALAYSSVIAGDGPPPDTMIEAIVELVTRYLGVSG